MIEKLQKRPFARPLLFWIIGIALYTFLPNPFLVAFILFSSILCLLFLTVSWKYGSEWPHFGMRGLYGTIMSLLVVCVAISVCFCSNQHSPSEIGLHAFMGQKASVVQHTLVESFDRLKVSDREKSILATLVVGYRSAAVSEMKRHFSLAGVSHILSVSGFHVGVICGFLSILLRPLSYGRVWRPFYLLFLIFGVWLYAFITGLAPSAVRASLMLTLYLLGKMLLRRMDSYNTLAASAFCMLAYNPAYLFDIGFQLSYSAVFSILYILPRIDQQIKLRNPLIAVPWGWITVSIAAQMGTVCLCFYYFGQFSTVFLFTNPPVSFLALLLIPLALLWLCFPVGFYGYDCLSNIVEFLVHAMVNVVELFSSLPYATITWRFDLFDLLIGYLFLAFMICYLQPKVSKILIIVSLFILLISLKILFS